MPICPVNLATCERPECVGEHCASADLPMLLICWQCGSLDAEHRVLDICTACLAAHETD